jgi:hypothetical protein
MRAFMWWEAAEWVKGGGWLPNEVPAIIAEATIPTYTFVNGQLLIEPKDKIKERLGRSPNYWDALSQTFALPDAPKSTGYDALVRDLRRKTRHAEDEYDPFRENS